MFQYVIVWGFLDLLTCIFLLTCILLTVGRKQYFQYVKRLFPLFRAILYFFLSCQVPLSTKACFCEALVLGIPRICFPHIHVFGCTTHYHKVSRLKGYQNFVTFNVEYMRCVLTKILTYTWYFHMEFLRTILVVKIIVTSCH